MAKYGQVLVPNSLWMQEHQKLYFRSFLYFFHFYLKTLDISQK